MAVSDIYGLELHLCLPTFHSMKSSNLLSCHLDQESLGAKALLLACLHPNATRSESSRLLMIVYQFSTRCDFMDSNTVQNCIIPALDSSRHNNIVRYAGEWVSLNYLSQVAT